MTAGAKYAHGGESVAWYYLVSANKPTQPVDIAAVNLIAVDANKFAHTTGDITVPAVNAPAGTRPNIEWEEHDTDAIQYRPGLKPAPTTDENTVEIEWVSDWQNTLHRALRGAAEDTYAVLIADSRTDEGDGVRGVAAGNAEGTIMSLTVQHADAALSLPTGSGNSQATSTFTIVKDASDDAGRKFFDYGEP